MIRLMGTRSKRSNRCPQCRMHEQLCICDSIPRFDVATRLVLVMHRREQQKPTATGPLALAVLGNSELRIQGHRDTPLDFTDLDRCGRRVLLLYPGDDVPVLSPSLLALDARPITLVVPDGSWRQAARMGRRLPGLEQVEMVRLPEGATTAWGIRKENTPQGLATFEAIARAMGIIEAPRIQKRMEDLFRLMVTRTLQTRG